MRLLTLFLFASAASAVASPAAFELDRRAILAMAGDFTVEFDFEETVAIQQGYALRDPYHSEATETVKLLADEGTRIVLQHILQVGEEGRVVKHWKQEWNYEDAEISTFRGENTWVTEQVPAEKLSGTWSQRVSQVDDSPRYESYGKWVHTGGLSSWTAEPTRRPLPRREYTKRKDYEVMMAVNRHTLSSSGWVHEQDNYKQVHTTGQILCREIGLNTYTRTEEVDFTNANTYWEQTSEYWAFVSRQWDAELATGRLQIHDVPGKPLYKRLFGLAKTVAEEGVVSGKTELEVEKIVAVFSGKREEVAQAEVAP